MHKCFPEEARYALTLGIPLKTNAIEIMHELHHSGATSPQEKQAGSFPPDILTPVLSARYTVRAVTQLHDPVLNFL